jgi:hypothetical protein
MRRLFTVLLILGLAFFSPPAAAPSAAQSEAPPTARDGAHDFDFLLGKWHTHYMLLKKRLVGDHEWYSCTGTSVIRPFWGGSGNLEDGDLHCPNRYVGGMTLRLYVAPKHQWELWWGTRTLGLMPPPQIGEFDSHGVGLFYAHDTYQGKPIIVRFKWTERPGDHPYFEQAFSPDNGKTWETNWTCEYTRIT